MGETIGKVFLDTTYYPGQDLYSDGAIEDEMLAIARDCAPEEFNSVIRDRESWPILYHFSHIRENILSWLPFTGEEKVLEIGAGCGAVTGALCKKAKEVTSIDLSMKRSKINAYRHRDQENLKILVGNFQEIEKNLTEKYDYITLIGVFEYGEAYIQSETPYVDFLKIIATHLKPDGKIVLAIENRLGLKYWAGCTEDHFGTLFEGLEGYPRTSGVKTFTKKEFGKILKEAGDLKAAWYYPFPDYKFPMTIYSEEHLPSKGELNRTEYNFDRFRLELFQESPVYDTLLENDLYPQFANSFLLLIGKEQPQMQTVYAKFSNERDRRFAICTEICKKQGNEKQAKGDMENGKSQTGEDKNGLLVKKFPAEKEAESHIRKLEEIYEKLKVMYQPEGIGINYCHCTAQGAELEFLGGITLEEKLDTLLEAGKTEELEALLFSYIEKIRRIHEKEPFEKTEDFIRVFGDVNLEQTLKGTSVSNIDLVPANILQDGDRVSVIDYEWTFFFPVPSQFLVYRMIHYYMESDVKRGSLKSLNFYEKAGITVREQEIYAEMEENFQKYMLGTHTSMLSLYDRISPGKANALEFYEEQKQRASRELQIFWDAGRDFNEEDSVRYPFKNDEVSITLKLPEHTTRLRLAPGEFRTGIYIRKMRWGNGEEVKRRAEGYRFDKDIFYFGGEDPQLYIDEIPEGAGTLELEMELLNEQRTGQKFWEAYLEREKKLNVAAQDLIAREKKLNAAAQNLITREKQVHTVENSRIWKIYRAIKGI